MADITEKWNEKDWDVIEKYRAIPPMKPRQESKESMELGPLMTFAATFFVGLLLFWIYNSWFGLPLMILAPIGVFAYIYTYRLQEKNSKEIKN